WVERDVSRRRDRRARLAFLFFAPARFGLAAIGFVFLLTRLELLLRALLLAQPRGLLLARPPLPQFFERRLIDLAAFRARLPRRLGRLAAARLTETAGLRPRPAAVAALARRGRRWRGPAAALHDRERAAGREHHHADADADQDHRRRRRGWLRRIGRRGRNRRGGRGCGRRR